MTESKPKRSRVSLLFARLLFFVVRGFDICGYLERISFLLFLFVPDDGFRGFQGVQEIFLISDKTREKDRTFC